MINRYSINECAATGMDYNDEGDYVTFDDYETLAAELDALRLRFEKLTGKLGELLMGA